MKTRAKNPDRLADEIEATLRKLAKLEKEIEEIGEPAAGALRHRLEALQVEEHALQRNAGELKTGKAGRRNAVRARKLETLLHHIEAEESSLEHDADFLHQASPTTLEFAFRCGSRVFDIGARGWKKATGGRQLMWHSPFVNNTHDSLASRYRMPDEKK